MPAIQPARLRQQAALLAGHFRSPAAFVRSLHHLFDFYADRAHRPGRAGEPSPLLKAYHVRPPVLRQVLHELIPLANEDPDSAFRLCDALWEKPSLEFRQLAASLLGEIPTHPPNPILIRVQSWIQNKPEERLMVAVLDLGLARLRKDDPAVVISLAGGWLNTRDPYYAQVGMRSLLPLVRDASFDHLPVFFDMLFPFIRQVHPKLRTDLLNLLKVLARRSPPETAYMLRQGLSMPESPDTPWVIRQVLGEFPDEIQERLRKAVRGKKWSRTPSPPQ